MAAVYEIAQNPNNSRLLVSTAPPLEEDMNSIST